MKRVVAVGKPKRLAVRLVKKAKRGVVVAAASGVARRRSELVLEQAEAAGLLGAPKDTVIRGRVPKLLVEQARAKSSAKSDTELIEIALSTLALEDDFGQKLLKRKGSIDPDIDLEF
jgi:hypothetical protein